ncbi:Uncharacterised protein [Neisseria animalis]|nr:Uncharacterised protein [Neisseria animalis]
MIQRCFALPYYVYCLRLRCLVSFLFYSTIFGIVCAFAALYYAVLFNKKSLETGLLKAFLYQYG